jgi:hypothetical protein
MGPRFDDMPACWQFCPPALRPAFVACRPQQAVWLKVIVGGHGPVEGLPWLGVAQWAGGPVI